MPADENFAPRNAGGAEDNLLGVHSRIGAQLRAFYSEIQEEAIPAHLLTLLERLDAAENGAAAAAEAAAKANAEKRAAAKGGRRG